MYNFVAEFSISFPYFLHFLLTQVYEAIYLYFMQKLHGKGIKLNIGYLAIWSVFMSSLLLLSFKIFGILEFPVEY